MIDFSQDVQSTTSGWWILHFTKEGETEPESSVIVPAKSLFGAMVLTNHTGVNPGKGYDATGYELEHIEKIPMDMLQRNLDKTEMVELEKYLADEV